MDLHQIEEKVKAAFSQIEHPQYKKSLMDLGMFGKLEQEGEDIRLTVKTPDQVRETQLELEAKIRRKLKELSLAGKLKIGFEFDESLSQDAAETNLKGVKNIIAVGSGKGGVGKSTVAANLAAAMVLKGFRVGLVDTDIYGPSVGKLFGMPGVVQLDMKRKDLISPVEVQGIKLMSFSFLLNPEQAIVWRGPLLGNAVQQLLFEIDWGELDYLIVDLPPGTGDVQLSLSQLVTMDGAVIVTTPQSVALLDAGRAITMFQQVKVPILGLVENMSEFICPNCGHVSHIFSREGALKMAEQFKVQQLGSIPLQTEIMESGEAGLPIVLKEKDGPIAKVYGEIVDRLVMEVKKYK